MSVTTTGFGTVSRSAARPVYQQIKDTVLDKIASGDWRPGEKVPSEHTLVAALGVSRMTVNRALRELTQRGHLRRVHGVGTFVAEPGGHGSLIELRDIADEIHASGRHHRAEVVRKEALAAERDAAERLRIDVGREVFRITVVHFQDGSPIQLEDRYINPELAPDFMQVDFSRTTPTRYLMGLCRPDEIEHVVQAVMPDAAVRAALAIPRTEPCLRLARRTWSNQLVVTSVSLFYPSSRYDLVARYSTHQIDDIYKGNHI